MRIHRIYAMTVVLAFAVAIGATSSFAQSATLRAEVPFDFYVADTLLPAGTYTITPIREAALRVSGANGNTAIVTIVGNRSNRVADASKLVFHRYGTTSFLWSVHWEGSQNTRELVTSPMEERLAKSGVSPTQASVLIKSR